MADLQRLRVSVHGQRVVILGAGGATRGILGPLLAAAPREVIIVNRTPERALQLAFESGALGIVQAWALDDLGSVDTAGLLIHATSAYRGGDSFRLPATLVDADTVAYDLGYGDSAAAFLSRARQAGVVIAHDGLGMLVEQAAESFQRWRGVRPHTSSVLRALAQRMRD
jgi:shikimate dehydrogenase